MARIHAIEFEDLPWFPSVLRNYMTDYLQFVGNKFKIFEQAIPKLQDLITDTKQNQIVDLCSGGGGSWSDLFPKLQAKVPDIKVMFTDLYPNKDRLESLAVSQTGLEFHNKSVNATEVPKELSGIRTQFLSFHHFRPDAALALLQNATDSGNPVAIFEAQERNLPHLIQFSLSFVFVLLLTPFIRPFSLGRLVFTYLIPLVPIFVFWDGIASVLRTYSVEEMESLIQKVEGNERFDWEVGKLNNGPTVNLFLIGKPK